MSFSLSLYPYAYASAAALGNAAAAASSVPIAQTAASVTAALAAGAGSVTGVHASVASAVSVSPAFLAVAVPLAATVMTVLAAGMTLEMVQFDRKMKRSHEMVIPTVFTDRKMLIDAICAYDRDHVCTIYEDTDGTITARMKLEDYIFEPDPDTGFFRLTIRNAGTCERMLAQINDLQKEYMRAVRSETYSRLRQSAQRNGWNIESEEHAKDGTVTLRVRV